MMEDLGPRLVGALFFALFISGLARVVVKPTPHLANRLRPYTAASRSMLGRYSDASLLTGHGPVEGPQGVVKRLYRPLVEALLQSIGRVFGAAFDDEALALKLKQAGVLADVADTDRVHEYRVRQVGSAL